MKTKILIIIIINIMVQKNIFSLQEYENNSTKISWCSKDIDNQIYTKYKDIQKILLRRTTIKIPENILIDKCNIGESHIWWFNENSIHNFSYKKLNEHITNGGVFIIEGSNFKNLPDLDDMSNDAIGLKWESISKNSMFYRSFYLLKTIDGCAEDSSKVLLLRKKENAKTPIGIVTSANFLSNKIDCFSQNYDYKNRSIINIFFSILTSDYKEDQRELPEILNRIRKLGLEP
jgi:hypothetical protein